MNDRNVWDALSQYLATQYGMRIRFKNESNLMRFIGWILFFNKAFMTDYITTIGRTIYFPTREDISGGHQWDVLAHEGIHIYDQKISPIKFTLSYLFPQVLAALSLLAILAIWNTWFLLSLAFLVALLPLPAPWRTTWERRGYLMSMCCDILRYGADWVNQDYYRETMVAIYTGPGYYFMKWGADRTRKMVELDRALANLIVSGITNKEPYESLVALINYNLKVSA